MKKYWVVLGLIIFSFPLQAKSVRLVFWHAMAGSLGQEVRTIAERFNQSQTKFQVIPVYKGNYLETLNSFSAAFRAHQAPAMVQVNEVGTSLMLSPEGIIKPLDSLLLEQGIKLPQDDFIQSVRQYYSRNGHLMAMPFNLSAPVIYYNRDLLTRLGYDTDNFPKTWSEMEVLAQKVKQAGHDCTYTTAYPGWILMESYLAIHGLTITKSNPIKVAINTTALLQHLERLTRWKKTHYFRYGGRVDDSTILFTSGVCPLFSQSSGAHNSLQEIVSFHLGVAALPLDTTVSSKRHANLAGGGAIWTVSSLTREQYKGVAEFFAFLAKPETQQYWHEHTGYLPIGFKGGYARILQSGNHPTLVLARKDLEDNFPVTNFQYHGPQSQMRGMMDEMLEAMFALLVTPEDALIQMQNRAQHLLVRFYRNTGQNTDNL